MSKELYFTDGNNEVKYLDTTASFNLAITQDGSAFDLTNATAIDVKVANDTGYVFDKSIDMATIKQPLAGLITMPVDAEVMNALVPDDYTIEVWVTLSSLITPGSQEGLTDGATTSTTTDTTTYNAIFPSDDPQGFTITENVMSDSGDVIPVMSLDDFQQEFDQLKTDLTNKVSTLKGPKGDTGQGLEIKGKVDTTSQLPAKASEGDGYLVGEELYVWTNGAWKDCGSLQGPQGIKGNTGTGVSSTTIQYQISNSATTKPTGTWSNSLIATTQVNPFLWTQVTLNYDDGTSKSFYLVSSKGNKGDKGDKGETGLVGPPGPVGAGLVVKGTVSNASQLPTTGNQEGYCYFVGTDLYVWDAGDWKNCGSVSPDLSNYVTVTDLDNGLSAKQDKIGYTPADDSKVVHDNHNGTITINGGSFTPAILDSAKGANAQPINTDVNTLLKPGLYYVSGSAPNNPFKGRMMLENRIQYDFNQFKEVQISYAIDAGVIAVRNTRPNGNLTSTDYSSRWVLLSDDSKVAHLSGANNFDTVPTVNNNPLLLASSLPSDLARTGSDQEFTGKNTFDVAPIDKKTGNPYITKDGVPAVPSTLADTTKDANFTGKLQKSGIDVATKSDVTTAVSTATANMVDSTKATNFTAGLKSGGVDVATAADLKSVADSAWRQLDNKYVETSGGVVSPVTTFLYKVDIDNKKIYFQGTIIITSGDKNPKDIHIDLSSIATSIAYSNENDQRIYYWGKEPEQRDSLDIDNGRLHLITTFFGTATILTGYDKNGNPIIPYLSFGSLP